MKRTLTQAGGGNDFELRDNKVRKINIFKKEGWQTLSDHDVLNQILAFVKKLRWIEMWKLGEISIMESKFDDGDLFHREFKYNITFADGLFHCWHNFLRNITDKKVRCGMSKWLTIQSCTYYSKSRGGLHSWESFHRSNFMVTDQTYESEDEVVEQLHDTTGLEKVDN